MHSLETGIVISIAAFFFFSFLTFTFLREGNISKDIKDKCSIEKSYYEKGKKMNYCPEVMIDIVDIFFEEDKLQNGKND